MLKLDAVAVGGARTVPRMDMSWESLEYYNYEKSDLKIRKHVDDDGNVYANQQVITS